MEKKNFRENKKKLLNKLVFNKKPDFELEKEISIISGISEEENK
jgi:hypothetical protein